MVQKEELDEATSTKPKPGPSSQHYIAYMLCDMILRPKARLGRGHLTRTRDRRTEMEKKEGVARGRDKNKDRYSGSKQRQKHASTVEACHATGEANLCISLQTQQNAAASYKDTKGTNDAD